MAKQPSNGQSEELMAWLAEARRLRTSAVESEVDFFAYLQEGEARPALWSGGGHPTFVALLAAENLTDTPRYLGFVAAVARFGLAHVRANGVDQMREVMRIPEGATDRVDPKKKADLAVLDEYARFRVDNHTPPSPRQAPVLVAKHWEAPPKPKAAPEPAEVRVKELEAKVRKLEAKVAKLEAENDQLRQQLVTRAKSVTTAKRAKEEARP